MIGVGFGAKVHLPALARLGIPITAVCASRIERAEAAAAPFGARATDSWRSVIDDGAADLVVVAAPPALQLEIALAGLAAGKWVVCEKPLGGSAAEAEELAAAAAAAGAPTLVDFELRALPAFLRARDLLDKRTLGRVLHMSVVWEVSTRLAHDHAPSWKDDAALGGGALASLGTHVFDYVEWLVGPVRRVAGGVAYPLRTPADDVVVAILELESDVLVDVAVSTVAHAARGHTVVVSGEHASLRIANPDLSDWVRGFELDVVRAGAAEREELARALEGEDGRIAPVAALLARFVRGEVGLPTFAEGARAHRIAHAVRESGRTGEWISVPRYNSAMAGVEQHV